MMWWCGRGDGLDNSATFLVTLPPILSAIRMAGDGGMRIQLDVPESEMGEAIKLLMWRERVLRITVEPEPGKDDVRRNQTSRHY